MPRFLVTTEETATGRYEVIADDEADARAAFALRERARGHIDWDAATQLELQVFLVEVVSVESA